MLVTTFLSHTFLYSLVNTTVYKTVVKGFLTHNIDPIILLPQGLAAHTHSHCRLNVSIVKCVTANIFLAFTFDCTCLVVGGLMGGVQYETTQLPTHSIK